MINVDVQRKPQNKLTTSVLVAMETISLGNAVLLHLDSQVVLTVFKKDVQCQEALLTGHTVVEPTLLRARPLGGVHFLKAHAALPPVCRGLVQLHVGPKLRLQGEDPGAGGTRELAVRLVFCLTHDRSSQFPSVILGTDLGHRSFARQHTVGFSAPPFNILGVRIGALLRVDGDVSGRVLLGMGPQRQVMQEDSTTDRTRVRLLPSPSFWDGKNLLPPWGRSIPAVLLFAVQVQRGRALEHHLTGPAAQPFRNLWQLGLERRRVTFPHMAVQSGSRADRFGTEWTLGQVLCATSRSLGGNRMAQVSLRHRLGRGGQQAAGTIPGK